MAYRNVQFPPWYFVRAPGEYHDVFGTVSAPANSTGNVAVSFTLPANSIGILLGVAFEAGQLTNFYFSSWSLQIGGAMHPYLNDVQGMISRINEPIAVWRVLKPSQRIRILVDNSNLSSAFAYGARLFLFVQEKSIPLGPGVSGLEMELRS